MRDRLLEYSLKQRPDPCASYSGLSYDNRFIDKWMLVLEKTSLTRENKIDESRRLGCGDLTKRFDVTQAEPSPSRPPSWILPGIRKQVT